MCMTGHLDVSLLPGVGTVHCCFKGSGKSKSKGKGFKKGAKSDQEGNEEDCSGEVLARFVTVK